MEQGKTGTVRMPSTFNEITADSLKRYCNGVCEANKRRQSPNILPIDTKIYFAGPWFTEKGKILYEACQQIERESNTTFKVFYPKSQINNTPKDAFKKNVKNIKECDVVVALVTEKDVGTAWEIGMAYALGKPIYLLGLDSSTFLSHTNVMLAFTGKCMTIREYKKFLTNNNPKFIKIHNDWEGIE